MTVRSSSSRAISSTRATTLTSRRLWTRRCARSPNCVGLSPRFARRKGHRLIVLPGSDDVGLRDDESAQTVLEDLGVGLARDLSLQVATANGVRDLAVAAGSYELDVTPVAPRDRADADRLEDPTSLERFVASRVLYRRLRPLGLAAALRPFSSPTSRACSRASLVTSPTTISQFTSSAVVSGRTFSPT